MYSRVKAIQVSLWGRHVGTIVPKTATHYRFVKARGTVPIGLR